MSSSTIEKSVTIYRGDDEVLLFSGVGPVTGLITLQVAAVFGGQTILQSTSVDGENGADHAAGKLAFPITAGQSASLPADSMLAYDVKIVDAGVTRSPFYGVFRVAGSITQTEFPVGMSANDVLSILSDSSDSSKGAGLIGVLQSFWSGVGFTGPFRLHGLLQWLYSKITPRIDPQTGGKLVKTVGTAGAIAESAVSESAGVIDAAGYLEGGNPFLGEHTTDELPEGASNRYYTSARENAKANVDLTNVLNTDFYDKAVAAGAVGGGSSDIVISQTSHGFTAKGTPIAKDTNTGLWTAAISYDGGGLAATAVVVGITDANTFTISTGNYLLTLTTGEWDALTGGTGGLIPGQTYYTSNTVPGKYTTAIQDLINPVLLAQSATEAIVQIGFVAAESGAGNIVQHKQFTGDGVTSDFTLDAAPSSVQYIIGFVGGAYQDPSKYTLVGNTMSFATPPLNGAEINVIAIIATTFNNDISQYVQRTTLTLADDAQVILNSAGAVFPTVANGMYEVWDQSDPNTYVLLSFKQNATPVVTLRDYSPDIDSVDADGFLCIYISGSDVILKNRLGSSKTFVIHRRT